MTRSNLTTAQATEVLAPSKRYPAADYAAVIADLKKSAKTVAGLAHVESSFPGVKPAHVAHMLKQLKGDDNSLTVDTHAQFGVCLIRSVAKPDPKPTAAKPAPAKKAARPKRTTKQSA